MTCSDPDENCPFIPGTEKRIPVRFEDPKSFDDTTEELVIYNHRSMQIASEMFYVFSKVRVAKRYQIKKPLNYKSIKFLSS